jgi:hypothetical protein
LPQYATGTGKSSAPTPQAATRSPSPSQPKRTVPRNGRPPAR